MARIKDCFDRLKQNNKKAFVAYLMAGDPTYQLSLDLLCQLPRAGVDIIEIGFPFTDPIADGPIIQRAAHRALQAGQTLAKTLTMVQTVRASHPTVPIVLMGYANPVLSFGITDFVSDAVAAGVDGVIIVDVPPEESAAFFRDKPDALDVIRLIAPTSDSHRLHTIAKHASGFVYYVSIAGVTGTASAIAADVAPKITRIKSVTDLPVVAGFGVKDTHSAQAIAQVADGVVVGSAIVERFERDQNPGPVLHFVTRLADSIHSDHCRPK